MMPRAFAHAFPPPGLRSRDEGTRGQNARAPFLLELVVKEGYDFSRYPLAGL